LKKEITFVLVIILWVVTAWLLYPLISLDSVDMENAKEYFYRTAAGITIMVIFYGKSIIDLFFPLFSSRKMPRLNTIFLCIYSLVLAGGIIFMVTRIVVLYLKSREGGFLF